MNQDIKNTKFLNYINIFRAIAILLIVTGHTFYYRNIQYNTCYLSRISSEIIGSGTCLFVFIAGFLFQHLSSKFEFKNYLKKKFLNIICPYLILSIPGIICCFTIPRLYGNIFWGWEPKIFQIIAFYTTGSIHNGPCWYIPMTTVFFLTAGILLKLEHKKILYKYLPYLLLVAIFTPRLYFVSPEIINNCTTYIQKYLCLIWFWISNTIHYFPAYILGMFFSAHKEYIDILYQKKLTLFLLMIFASMVNIFLMTKYNLSNGDLSKAFFMLLVLGYLKHYDKLISSKILFSKVMDFIAKYSFGIFFLHSYMIRFFEIICKYHFPQIRELYMFYTYSDLPIWFFACCVKFLIVMFECILICFIVKKILEKLKIKNTRTFIGV